MSINTGFMVLVTIIFVVSAALVYFVPKFNNWADEKYDKRKQKPH
ncbi:hypothetical protein [Acidihalobacter aeolianus]|nr:hypothetical protein [Acidihalobacter aeolianus]